MISLPAVCFFGIKQNMNIGGFLSAAVLLTLMPGPDILFVITQSIIRGRRAGIVFALGLCTGLIVHVAAVSLGISLLLKESPVAFTVLKLAGAAYLIYLGIRAFLNRHLASWCMDTVAQTADRLYVRGIVMNLLNPKVILFFLAFFPQFISVGSLHPMVETGFLGLLFILQAVFIFSAVAFLAGRLSERLMRYPRIAYWMNISEALIYGAIGISIILV